MVRVLEVVSGIDMERVSKVFGVTVAELGIDLHTGELEGKTEQDTKPFMNRFPENYKLFQYKCLYCKTNNIYNNKSIEKFSCSKCSRVQKSSFVKALAVKALKKISHDYYSA